MCTKYTSEAHAPYTQEEMLEPWIPLTGSGTILDLVRSGTSEIDPIRSDSYAHSDTPVRPPIPIPREVVATGRAALCRRHDDHSQIWEGLNFVESRMPASAFEVSDLESILKKGIYAKS